MDDEIVIPPDPIEQRLKELEGPIRIPVSPLKRDNATFPPDRDIMVANSPDELVGMLGLNINGGPHFNAGLFAFVARNPGQAKKVSPEWHARFRELGGTYSLDEWLEVVRVGELIASHRYVKTPFAPR